MSGRKRILQQAIARGSRRRALGVAAVAATGTAVLAGCAPVEAGAAIVTHDQRVSTAQVEGLAGQITAEANQYGLLQPNTNGLPREGVFQSRLTPTDAAVGVFVKTFVWGQVAKDQNITVSDADLAAMTTELTQVLQVTPDELPPTLLAADGYPLARTNDLIRVAVIQQKTLTAHGLPAADLFQGSADGQAVLADAHARAANELGLTVSPRYPPFNTAAPDFLTTPSSDAAPSGDAAQP